uniref:Uncharacterized protein n=1 Tax=Arundo donax TaxID=35708 RepID=A0A0A8YDV3_ARUDO
MCQWQNRRLTCKRGTLRTTMGGMLAQLSTTGAG